jgi:hypothetical protein
MSPNVVDLVSRSDADVEVGGPQCLSAAAVAVYRVSPEILRAGFPDDCAVQASCTQSRSTPRALCLSVPGPCLRNGENAKSMTMPGEKMR